MRKSVSNLLVSGSKDLCFGQAGGSWCGWRSELPLLQTGWGQGGGPAKLQPLISGWMTQTHSHRAQKKYTKNVKVIEVSWSPIGSLVDTR